MAQLGARFHGMEEVVGSIPTRSTKFLNNLDVARPLHIADRKRTRDAAALTGAAKGETYFILPMGRGMSELKMSHSVFQAPFDFFSASIHLPWST